METTILYILGLYGKNGKSHGNLYTGTILDFFRRVVLGTGGDNVGAYSYEVNIAWLAEKRALASSRLLFPR